MHYFKRNIGDYHKKAGRLSMVEHGAYTLLIDACYDRERFPTFSDAIEWTWARTEEEMAAVRFVLGKFFILQDGLYIQTRIQEEITNYKVNSDTNKRIALEREEKRRTNRARTVHEAPPNQEPLTNKPLTNKPTLTSLLDKSDAPNPKCDALAILAYLNVKAGSAFRPVEPNIKLIRARFKDGATQDEMKAVIDLKVKEWSNDDKMREYLRPSTLFNSTKYAQYAGQINKVAQARGFVC